MIEKLHLKKMKFESEKIDLEIGKSKKGNGGKGTRK